MSRSDGTCVRRRGGALEVGLDRAVLLVEERHVGHEVLDDVHVGERVDARLLGGVCGDAAQAGQGVDAVDVHGAASADALATTPPEGEGGVDLVLDADERVQHHGAGLVEVERVRLHLGLRRRLVRVPSVDVERLGARILAGLGLLLGRRLALGDDLAGGFWHDALGDLGDGLAGGRVGDGGKTAREDGRPEGCVNVVSSAQWHRAGARGAPTCAPRSQTGKSACAGHCGWCGVESAGCLGVRVLRSSKFKQWPGPEVVNTQQNSPELIGHIASCGKSRRLFRHLILRSKTSTLQSAIWRACQPQFDDFRFRELSGVGCWVTSEAVFKTRAAVTLASLQCLT